MARFNTTGLDDVLADMKRLGELTGETANKMLMAGAEQDKQAWRQAAEKHRIRDKEALIDSIGFARKPKDVGGIKTIDIYPQGKDAKGVRNAEKAFILHYGTSGSDSENAKRKRKKVDKRPGPGIPGTHWVDDADEMAAPLVTQAMTEIWDNHLKGK